MLNIELQACSLIMLLILLLIFIKEKGLDSFSRQRYQRALLSCIFCLTVDILSIYLIYDAIYQGGYILFAKVVCKLYVLLLVYQAYQGFIYATGNFFTGKRHRKLHLIYRIWIITGLFFIVILPAEFHMDGSEVYSYGYSNYAAYLLVGVLIITCIVMTVARVGGISERRRWAILLWQGAWLVAAIVQFICPTLLLSGFAAAMGMVLIHAELENPNEVVDRMTGQFSANALITYVTDRYQYGVTFASMHIRLSYLSRNVDLETVQTVLLRCANFLAQYPGGKIFRMTDDTFVILLANEDELEKAYQQISEGIDAAVGLPVDYSFVRMPDSNIVDSADEYFRLHHYYDNLFTGRISAVVDKEAVDKLRRYDRVQEMVRSALHDGRVEVYFQPFYEVATKRYTSAEALVRINAPDGTVISPCEFVSIAEENGLIVPLGIEIFRQVCEFLSDGRAKEAGLESVEVNISVAQFDKENPAEFVTRLLEIYHVEADMINLEITETASSMARKLLISNMERLREVGVSFSLDDFGTGRSNLDYFVEMPVERVKFDYSLTQQFLENDRARCVIESVVDMVHHMGLSVVAEGVETKEQLDAMCGIGVEFIQGFFYSKPLKKEEFIDFLKEKNGRGKEA